MNRTADVTVMRKRTDSEKDVPVSCNGNEENLSYIKGPNDVPLLRLTVGQLLEKAASSYEDKIFAVFVHQSIRKTLRQVLNEADQLAAGLLSLGFLERGDRIGIWGSNSYQWFLTQWAAARAGLVLVTINPAYRANELRYALKLTEVKVLIMDQWYRNHCLSEVLKELLVLDPNKDDNLDDSSSPDLPYLKKVIVISDDEISQWPKAIRFSELLARASITPSFSDMIRDLQRCIQPDDPAAIIFTSGTTGTPKGATLSHDGLVSSSYFAGCRKGYQDTPGHVMCVPLALHHVYGYRVVFEAANHGVRMVFPGPQFSARETARAIQRERCTVFYGTPTMAMDILHLADRKDFDLSSLSTGIMGGARCPIELARTISENLNIKDWRSGYGMTETISGIFMSKKTDSLEVRCSTVGCVVDHMEVKIVNPLDGEIVPIGERGELCTRGYGMMLGYWNQPDETNRILTKDGWLHSGDLGILDENGYLQIVGRIKDVIIRGGENIYPREIEEILHTHPGIQEAQVVGVPDFRLGESVCAWIRCKEEQIGYISQEELKMFCQGEMAYFKVPRYWLFTQSSFPATTAGKVQKFALKEMAIKELGL